MSIKFPSGQSGVPPVSMRYDHGLSSGADAHSVTFLPTNSIHIAGRAGRRCVIGTVLQKPGAAGIIK